MSNKFKVKRGTNLSNITTAPEAGELIYKSDTQQLYVGDGSTAANALTAIGGGGNSTATSSFLTGDSLVSYDGYIMTRGIVNENETGGTPSAITFGNGATYANDNISLITSGNTRIFLGSTGQINLNGTITASGRVTSTATGGFTIGNYAGYDRIQNSSNSFSFLTDGNAYANMEFATVTAGTWNGSVIASAYLDSDTAHLSGSQTFSGNKTFTGKLLGDTTTTSILNGATVTNVNDGFTNDIGTGKAAGLQPFRYSNNTTNTPLGGGSSMANNANWGLSLYSHGTGGSGNYGLQMSGGDNDNQLFFIRRVSNGSFSSWFEMWHSGNDGANSGLDADLLDGNHASAFLTSVPNHSANLLTSGTVPLARISGLTTDNIASDAVIEASKLGALPASKITSGTFANARIPSFSGDVTGTINATVVADNSHNHHSITSNTGDPGDSRLQYWQVNSNTTLNPTSDWYTAIRMGHGDPVTYYSNTIAVKMTGSGTGDLYTRNTTSGTAGSWNKHWHDNNDGAGSGLDADTLDGSHASAFLTSSSSINATTLDNYDSSRFFRREGSATATVGPGWMTVATNVSGRRAGEILVTDADSSDHGFIRLHWLRSYADSNFTVINTGGHQNRITGVRVLSQDSDNTYGGKRLQVYVEASSSYDVKIFKMGDDAHYTAHTVNTPTIENTFSGYSVHGNSLEDLDTYGFAHEEGILAGGVIKTQSNMEAVNITASGKLTTERIDITESGTVIGDIQSTDTTWLRLNQSTNKNIYTPRYIRADAGFFVDGATQGITGDGTFRAPNGSNGTPSISFASDTNTGMFRIGSDTLGFSAGGNTKLQINSDGRINYNGWTGVDHITVRSNGHTNSGSSSTFYIKFCTVVVDNSPANYNGLSLSGTLYNGDNNHGNTIDWSVWFNAALDNAQIAHGGYMMSKGAHWISNIFVQRTAGDGEIDNGSCTYELYYDINNNWANNFYNVATEVHYPSEGKFNVTWNHDQSEVTSLPGTEVINMQTNY